MQSNPVELVKTWVWELIREVIWEFVVYEVGWVSIFNLQVSVTEGFEDEF